MAVKGSYYDPDGNGIHFSPIGQSFGICPMPDFTKQHLEMLAIEYDAEYPSPSIPLTIEDVLQLCALPLVSVRRNQLSTYQYLTVMQNTKYPVTQIHTKREEEKFWALYNELEAVHNKSKPDFVKMAKEWCRRTNTFNQSLAESRILVDFYKLPNYSSPSLTNPKIMIPTLAQQKYPRM
ncbi:hypothetical protein [Parasitella parasitica]|uniref:Uncharacterized protein n=1 Tax=Parasitella parasitica TaxID=35722 RepID=A0A0B7N3A6_9FUNG|nr:hypothetical protein [Parasitella parasitica]